MYLNKFNDARPWQYWCRLFCHCLLTGLLFLGCTQTSLLAAGKKDQIEETATTAVSMLDQKLLDLVRDQALLLQRIAREKEKNQDSNASSQNLSNQSDLERQARMIAQKYESIIASNPNEIMPLILYGKFARQVGDTEKSFNLFQKADKLDPNLAVVKQQLGNYLAETDQVVEALTMFLKAVELEPDNAVYHYQVGELLTINRATYVMEDVFRAPVLDEKLQSAFRTAAELASDNIRMQMRYGESFYDVANPDWQAALNHWNRILPLTENQAQRQAVFMHQAWAYVRLDRPDEAYEKLKLISLPALQYNRYQLLSELGYDVPDEYLSESSKEPAETEQEEGGESEED